MIIIVIVIYFIITIFITILLLLLLLCYFIFLACGPIQPERSPFGRFLNPGMLRVEEVS